MQSLAGYIAHIGIVQVVPDQRIAQIFHVNSDLVGAPRFQPQRNQSMILKIAKVRRAQTPRDDRV